MSQAKHEAPTAATVEAGNTGQHDIHEAKPCPCSIAPLGQECKRDNVTGLILIERKGTPYADSRDVAQYVGKRHDNLVRDIGGYCDDLAHLKFEDSTDSPALPSILNAANFFVPGTYKDASGKKNRMYWITRKGCEFVANKLTGRKGTLFTAAYIERFHQMEQLLELRTECPALTEAIAWRHENPQAYHFSNEFDMINRVALGMKAKQFKAAHNIDPGAGSIRPYLPPEELSMVNMLQRVDIGLLYAGLSTERREELLRQRVVEASQARLAGRGCPA